MASPYSTPRYPGAPNPTPRSTQKGLRPPIHNPYDKFTQLEFDAWIGDITGALKRALGREELPAPAERAESHPADDEGVEDSFAEVKARRLAKGKERARDEDFEEAPRVETYDDEEDGWGEEFDGEEYSDEESGESGASEEDAPRVPNGSKAEVIDLLSDDEDADGDEPEEDEGSDEEGEHAVADYDEEAEGSSADSGDEEEPRSSPAAGPSRVAHSFAHEVTEIVDSDEEQEEPEQAEEPEEQRAIPARFQRKPAFVVQERSDSGEEENDELHADDEQAEEEDVFPPREKQKSPVDIDDPWRGPSTYAEDFYSGGDIPTSAIERGNPHTLPAEDEDELPADESAQTPDLPDPWEGPRQFAEDFYAGGDALPDPADGATPSHLTPKDDGRPFIPGISSAQEEPVADTREDETAAPGTDDIEDLYADAKEASPEPATQAVQDDGAQASGEEDSADDRSPSPPSATLRTHVDWNWPPAFPGRVATRPGHLDGLEREVYEISDDDEEDELAPSPQPVVEQLEPATEPPAAPIIAVQVQAEQTAAEDHEPLPQATDDTSGLYGEFDDLYDLGPSGAPFDMHTSFEPISPPNMDFGDLPAFTHGFTAATVDEDIRALDAAEAPPALEVPVAGSLSSIIAEQGVALSELVSSAFVGEDTEVPVAVSETRRYSVGLEEVTDEDEPPKQLESTAEPAMVVVELEEEDDIRSSAPLEDDIDVSSVRGSVEVTAAEYVVEEVFTEGRRTEEPEHVWEAPSHAPASEEPLASAAPEPEESSPTANPESAAPAPMSAPALARTRSSDFPPPISANPDVPDPASLTHTPSPSPSLPSPANLERHNQELDQAHDARALPPNAALHPLFRKLVAEGRTRSPSGLFTPLTEGGSASVTPEGETSPSPKAFEADADASKGKVPEAAVDLVGASPQSVEEDNPAGEAVEHIEEVDELVAGHIQAAIEHLAAIDDSIASSREVSPEIPLARPALPEEAKEAEPHSPEDSSADVVAVDFAAANGRDASPGSDADADAEGEVDPEYVSSLEDAAPETPEVLETTLTPVVKEDTILQEADGDGAKEVEPPVEAADVKAATEDSPTSPPAEAPESEPADQTAAALEPVSEKSSSPEVEAAAASSPPAEQAAAEAEDEVRPLKRKRGSAIPATRIPRLTRSRTSASVQNAFMDHVEKKAAKPRATKGKGKAKAKAMESDEEDNASVAHSQSSRSTSGGSSTAAQKMLVPSSRGTSRASSVASNAPSAYSGLSQPSPTIDRVLPSNGHQGPPPPFIHNHGILHHHHGRPMAPVVPVVPKRQPSEPPASASVVARRASAEPGPSSQPLPSSSRAAVASATSSPVTRSNCRFHTVSIPKEEEDDSPRVLFAVPGCSLGGNAELMKDEEIEDQGFVKTEDIPRLIRDVESLNFSPYLVGILRQFVGVDLLREQEVFYIPRPDDGVVLQPRKKKSHRAKLKQRESISARTFSNGGVPRAKNASSMAPPSQASVSTSGDSISTAGRLSQKGSLATSVSLSGSDLSDLEDEDARPAKRVKESLAAAEPGPEPEPEPEAVEQPLDAASTISEAPSVAAEENASTSTVVSKERKLQPRRSRRLGVDNLAYKPDGGESDGSGQEDETDPKKKRKKGGKRGLKRTRTEENGEAPTEGTPEKPKRRRVRTSTSNGHKPAADTEEAAS